MQREDLISYLERLVLVRFTESERKRIMEEINKILDFFKSLDEIKELDNYEPLFHVHDIEGPTREDEPSHEVELQRSDVMLNAVLEKGYVKAPRTIEE
ncbi:MAG TPA: Asp-tRNA(Asn)/Glu-tRNA(Gln) amidotransferase subunit GatC [Ignisphaera sp.]|uniref:Asp-tRNA(Asn)/Glu-tRNA(Gln) amidotransferase subunit GatC n=1 Tax=Ignisphaera aggregans TaxID=334771 RepID=A0A832YYK0_9CREN|nr:Asp-tRNA(Asn)/Glu-tRNA(Gln) amidotransferase subunit GatC [Ignisphaera sp.]HIP57296.1 Asp-tRNA(Asn)/Glu-tRNA(Gln) amidotransferase subunit GatC [Ignisphaera aggregans]